MPDEANHAGTDDLTDFELIESEVQPFHIGNRTRSTALLAWFLETVWRLEAEDASDSICDGGGDKGIDAIHVDEDAKEITIFQAKRRSADHLTQGDNDLKNFIGTAAYFDGPEGIDALLESAPNEEVRRLVDRLALRSRLEDADYGVRRCSLRMHGWIMPAPTISPPVEITHLSLMHGRATGCRGSQREPRHFESALSRSPSRPRLLQWLLSCLRGFVWQ